MTEKSGRLFVVATPIGNLEDITLRALKVLKEVDIIVCEDTRHSKKLLSHYGISKNLISYYKPFEKSKINNIIELLLSGKDIALISDAGTPAISDPGDMLIKEAREKQIEVIAIPGPSSLITALSISGFQVVPFIFDGFPSKKKSEMIKRLEELKESSCNIVYFVPARGLTNFLNIVKDTLGDRRVFIGRELTKLYEEVRVGRVSEILIDSIVNKGEAVVIIECKNLKEEVVIDDEIKKELIKAIKEKKTFKDLIKNVKFRNIKRNELYKLFENLKKT